MTGYKNKTYKKDLKLDTKLVRSGTLRSNYGETSEAIYLNSGFCYNSAEVAESRFNGEAPGFVYSRYVNPSLKMLEDRIVSIEKNAEAAIVCASGMAAVFSSIMCQIKAGDHIIANKVLFGSCHYIITKILPNYNINYTLVDGEDLEQWKNAFKENTKLVFIETPSNPLLGLVDIQEVAKLCKKHNAKFIVDNIFATPLIQSPLELGADIVVYSTTKHMDGGGKTLGGAVVGNSQFINEILLPFHRHTGPAMSPFNAWAILKSLETFSLRVEKTVANATKIANLLSEHKNVSKVLYPSLVSHPQHHIYKKQMKSGGGLIAFEIKGGKKNAFQFMNNLEIVDISNNLGDSKSLITHPASTTHFNIEKSERDSLGITEGMVRLSVGIEDADDLCHDIKNALDNI